MVYKKLWKYFQENTIVGNTDKGGAVVNMGLESYTTECKWHLNETNSYKILQNNPTHQNNLLVKKTLEQERQGN